MAIELRYVGRRTGREYVLPVQYAGTGGHLVVRPQALQRSTWWRAFRAPAPVAVRLAGRLLPGSAQLVEAHEPAWEQARQLYSSRWRRSSKGLTGPLVVITLDPDIAPPQHGT